MHQLILIGIQIRDNMERNVIPRGCCAPVLKINNAHNGRLGHLNKSAYITHVPAVGVKLLRVFLLLLLQMGLLFRTTVTAAFWIVPRRIVLFHESRFLGIQPSSSRFLFRSIFVTETPATVRTKVWTSSTTPSYLLLSSQSQSIVDQNDRPSTRENTSPQEISSSQSVPLEPLEHHESPKTDSKNMTLYIFQHPTMKGDQGRSKLYGLGISLAQFRQFVLYHYPDMLPSSHPPNLGELIHDDGHDEYDEKINIISYISSRDINVIDSNVKQHLRELWYERKLIVHKTDVISVYPSETIQTNASDDDKDDNHDTSYDSRSRTYKRGGAYDMVSSYSDRLLGIWREEMERVLLRTRDDKSRDETSTNITTLEDCSNVSSPYDLKQWLEHSYGKMETQLLDYTEFSKLSKERQRDSMQHFLDWFKNKYPYYYDRCHACLVSYKEEKEKDQREEGLSECHAYDHEEYTKSDHDELEGSFLGYLYPSENELVGKATRTELYQCHVCHEYYRFPRFNSLQHIISHGQGRCGEYSILLYLILRSLGHQVRWVVDWSDHVWAELRLGDVWVHMDPCEAAFNKPLLYQEWGKLQTYIIAFWIPFNHLNATKNDMFPFIEDVTYAYTSDTYDEIQKRREEDVTDIIHVLQKKMQITVDDLTLHSKKVT